MADIELVIKIPEEDCEIMKHNVMVSNPLCPLSEEEMVTIVANGTPFPKGHGRLIDAGRLKEVFRKNTGYDYHDLIDIAPTIIESESEDNE